MESESSTPLRILPDQHSDAPTKRKAEEPVLADPSSRLRGIPEINNCPILVAPDPSPVSTAGRNASTSVQIAQDTDFSKLSASQPELCPPILYRLPNSHQRRKKIEFIRSLLSPKPSQLVVMTFRLQGPGHENEIKGPLYTRRSMAHFGRRWIMLFERIVSLFHWRSNTMFGKTRMDTTDCRGRILPQRLPRSEKYLFGVY